MYPSELVKLQVIHSGGGILLVLVVGTGPPDLWLHQVATAVAWGPLGHQPLHGGSVMGILYAKATISAGYPAIMHTMGGP